ncbi:serine/arginine-rich splicing factor 2-like [Camellia sinensis]|uniref:serine/arginine-rich splicing factor 2-like n=1 Tax=Camellia sinensis TaxID=4442 RepID=UPI0010367BBF|nr:serine/arginine-rich splicing factor 2-like [Camellia sinensis]
MPVVRARGRPGPWRTEGSVGVFTVSVDNLPASLNPKGLFNLFTKFEVVKDVFIPQKRRRVTNIMFGFVRFYCFMAAKIVVQKANGLWVDDGPLQVKSAEFGKDKVGGEATRIPLSTQVRRLVVHVTQGRDGRTGQMALEIRDLM